jgi:hypothetical protein
MTAILEGKTQDERMPQLVRTTRTTRSSFALGVAAAFLMPTPATSSPGSTDPVAELRALGPQALAGLLLRYDQLPAGAERDALGSMIDRVAAQRYATVSRLYWYTDLARAKAAAQSEHRPILALRMLGRLDEDLSCANSRLFRTTLYANAGVSKFLRENFVLYWSSERPVPKVTIDMGDGRKLERTLTGNSAHYVLDESGNVLDVLPGLYAPAVFQNELAKTLQLATSVRGVDARHRVAATLAFHSAALEKRAAGFRKVAGTQYVKAKTPGTPINRAQRATVSKAVMEMPDLGSFGMDPGTIPPADIQQWTAIGQGLWRLGSNARIPGTQGVFDAQSEALITQLHTAVPAQPAAPNNTPQVIARLENTVTADTALNELTLRAQIRRGILQSKVLDFDRLNTWIYADVFHTPRQDAWLGLLPRTDFTGLPGDGVVMP